MKNSELTAAVEKVLGVVRKHHPDLRPHIVTVHRDESRDVRGYFHQDQWKVKTVLAGETVLEGKADTIHISSTILSEGAESVLRTILHESVHSIAVTRKVEDTSRQGRYHNARFAALAGELGLVVEPDKQLGCRTTGLTEDCKKRYTRELALLAKHLLAWQDRQGALAGEEKEPKQPSRMIKLVCSCGRIIRASREVIEAAPINCGRCGEQFEEEES